MNEKILLLKFRKELKKINNEKGLKILLNFLDKAKIEVIEKLKNVDKKIDTKIKNKKF